MNTTRLGGYVIKVKTDRELGTTEFAYDLLTSWFELPSELHPDHFDSGEPVRRRFETEGIQGAVRLWAKTGMPLHLTRRPKPRMSAAMSWRAVKGKDPRPFPWGCTVWLSRTAGDHLALVLFRFLLDRFSTSFGWITTEEDLRSKHLVTYPDCGGVAEVYMGLDVGRFVTVTMDYGREILPGVYWVTYFGPGAMAVLGYERLTQLEAYGIERVGEGILVSAYPSSREIGTPLGLRAEASIRDQLGRERFFDKTYVDVEGLKTDAVTAAKAERRIQGIKADRGSG